MNKERCPEPKCKSSNFKVSYIRTVVGDVVGKMSHCKDCGYVNYVTADRLSAEELKSAESRS